MAHAVQLDLFQSDEDFSLLEIKLMNEKISNIRKGLFKRHTELAKAYLDIQHRQEKIESRLYAIEKLLKEKFSTDLRYDGTFGFD